MTSRLIFSGVFFLFMIASGIWLSRLGRPLNAALFNVHKIAALIFVVSAVLILIKLFKTADLANPMKTAALLIGLFLLAGFVSGALLSFDKMATAITLTIHKIAPILITLCTAALLYLRSTGK